MKYGIGNDILCHSFSDGSGTAFFNQKTNQFFASEKSLVLLQKQFDSPQSLETDQSLIQIFLQNNIIEPIY